jgi:hypothetical protein
MEYYSGTTRISNPKTLQRWIDFGWFDETIKEGYTFNVGCGRFREGEKCTCSQCRTKTRPELVEVLTINNRL